MFVVKSIKLTKNTNSLIFFFLLLIKKIHKNLPPYFISVYKNELTEYSKQYIIRTSNDKQKHLNITNVRFWFYHQNSGGGLASLLLRRFSDDVDDVVDVTDDTDDNDDDRRPLFESLRKSEAIFWSLRRSTALFIMMVLPTCNKTDY